MKQRTAILIALIVIMAAAAVVLVMRKDLRQVRLRTGQTEVAVFMDYEPR